ncbi:c-type cytochrome [Aestuariibacter halophilus]|uniref:C-type cytochrome n=1 Tax=Fluctibacter halophilus TaxID=226011 RepID=A0ABS8G7I6_9ALTE|nr:c-type cytochrome [Aestuariibacter halophilus]MCC2616552.1 c-type cytochrome [Aestuariibacter halophilus]
MPLRIAVTLSALVLLCCAAWRAQATPDSGTTTYTQCAACHGDRAQGNDTLQAPALAGQYDWYLDKQLNDFRRGARGSHPEDTQGAIMAASVSGLAPDDQTELVAWLASLAPVSTARVEEGSFMNGERYYQGKCGACHGAQGEGNPTFHAPRLQGLSVAYVMTQMDKFRNGIRGSHPDDRLGRQMAMMANTVSDEELRDILLFIQQRQDDAF